MLGLDFRPFHPLLRWRNAHLAQPNSAFAALNQAKIIENRLASPKPDRLLGARADCVGIGVPSGKVGNTGAVQAG